MLQHKLLLAICICTFGICTVGINFELIGTPESLFSIKSKYIRMPCELSINR
jgi:hypothetical protein